MGTERALEALRKFVAEPDEERIREELADVLAYCLHLADDLGIDVDTLVVEKVAKNELKYPVEKSKGTSHKYDRL
jgi:dCTP diphosphatase